MTLSTGLRAGQNLLLNRRVWHITDITPTAGRRLKIEAIGASEAAQGMTRRFTAYCYGDDLFIDRGRQPGYWQANISRDWVTTSTGPALAARPATPLDLLAAHTRHSALGDLKNRFSWSYARAAKYQHCPRAYYYHYYAAWEGWRSDAPAPVQHAYLLKNLVDLPAWAGTLAHDALKTALTRLKTGQPVVEAELLYGLRTRARADYADSYSGRYRQQPNQLTGFAEHYYQTNTPAEAWQAAWQHAEACLQNFLRSELCAFISRLPAAAFLAIEELRAFELEGEKVWVQPDLVVKTAQAVVLYDWKTGPVQADTRRQVGLYGLYTRQAWPELAHLPLQAVVFNLAQNRADAFDLDEDTLAQTRRQAEAGIARLKSLLIDPLENLADMARFPMIEDLAVCRACRFKELCGR